MKDIKKYLGICVKGLLFILMIFMMVKANYEKNIQAKAIASMCFVIVGVMNYLADKDKKNKYSIGILLALAFGIIGDVSIMKNFMMGALFFLGGHVMYFIAYHFILPFEKRQLIDLLISWIATEVILLALSMLNYRGFKMMVVCFAYATVISLIVGKAVYNHRMIKDKKTLVICIASIAFLVSDIFVAISAFRIIHTPLIRMIGLCIYYPSQFVLAQTILRKREQQKVFQNVA